MKFLFSITVLALAFSTGLATADTKRRPMVISASTLANVPTGIEVPPGCETLIPDQGRYLSLCAQKQFKDDRGQLNGYAFWLDQNSRAGGGGGAEE